MTPAPSGRQFEITHGDQRATIVEVGGGVREYVSGERDVLQPYPVDRIRDGANGALLAPWPNRLADGRHSWDGADHQVDITEPGTFTAIHGFLLWRPWSAVDRGATWVTMAARLHPMPAYPFAIDLRVTYQLGDEGLEVTTTATNVGERAAPYGVGQHPYLSSGHGLIDDCELRLGASTRIVTDERLLPVDTEPVTGTDVDFRTPQRLGGLQIDHAFTDLDRDEQGRAWAGLRGADGATAQLWVDEHYPFIQLFTGDTLAPGRRRRGLGVEPMSMAPNALGTGEGVIRLEPGAEHTARWGSRLARPEPGPPR